MIPHESLDLGVTFLFYLTTHRATPEFPEIRNAYHSVLVSLLLSVDMFLSLCAFAGRQLGVSGLSPGATLM